MNNNTQISLLTRCFKAKQLYMISTNNNLEKDLLFEKICGYQITKDDMTREPEITFIQNLFELTNQCYNSDYKVIINNELKNNLLYNNQLNVLEQYISSFEKNIKTSIEILYLRQLYTDLFKDLKHETIGVCESLREILKKRGDFVNEQEPEFMESMLKNAFYYKSIKNFYHNDIKDLIFIKLTNDNIFNSYKNPKDNKIFNQLNELKKTKEKIKLLFDLIVIFPFEILKLILEFLIIETLDLQIFKQLLLWVSSGKKGQNYSLSCLNDIWIELFKLMKQNKNCYFILYKLKCKTIIKWYLF